KAEVDSDRPLSRASVQASVILPDERRLPLAFAVDAADPGVFRAEYEASTPGPHRIVAALVVGGQNLAETTTVIDVAPAPASGATTVDRANLQRIASATGGRFIDLADPGSWP